jgi:hypothetical protein
MPGPFNSAYAISDVGMATIAASETGKRVRVHPATQRRLARALKVKPHEL